MPCTVANTRAYRGSMHEAVYVGRPSMYGNPFKIDSLHGRMEVIELFRRWWFADINKPIRAAAVDELKDKVLLCWCVPQPCHAQVIAKFVNEYWESRSTNAT